MDEKLILQLREQCPSPKSMEDNPIARRAHEQGWKGFADVLLLKLRQKAEPHPALIQGTDSLDREDQE